MRHHRDGDHLRALVHAHEAHALRVAADHADLFQRHAHDRTVVADEHQILLARDHSQAGEIARPVRQHHGEHALSAPAVQRVLVKLRALAHALFGHGEHGGVRPHLDHIHHCVVPLQRNGAHAGGRAAHGAHIVLRKAHGLALLRGDEEFVVAVRELHRDELVALAEVLGDQPALSDVLKLGQRGFLNHALPRRHDQEAVGVRIARQRDGGRNLFAALQLQQVYNRDALGRPPGLGNGIALDAEYATHIGKEQDGCVGAGHKEAFDKVLLPRGLTLHAPAAAALRAVGIRRQALDVAKVRHGNGHVLLLDHIVKVDVVDHLGDLRPARIGVAALHLQRLLLDDGEQHPLVREDALQIGRALLELAVLLQDFIALQPGQALQAHVQNGLGLAFAQGKALHEARLGLRGVRRLFDEIHDLVDVVQRDDEAREDVQAFPRLFKVVFRAPGNDRFLVLEIVVEHLPQRQHLRFAVHQRNVDYAEGVLHGRVLVKQVQNDVCVHVLFQLDDDAHAGAVRLIPQVGDALDPLFVYQLRNALHKAGLVHLIGYLRNDDAAAVSCVLLNLRPRAHDDLAAARAVGAGDAHLAHDDAARGKVRPGQVLHEFIHRDVGLVDHRHQRIHRLAQIVRRDIRRHTHRNAARAVDQQVWHAAGQHRRLHERLVEVRHEIDRVLLDVGHHLGGHFGKPRLGVAHGRRAVAVHRAEVAVSLHQRIARGEGLRKAHHGLIDRGVAMRMVFAEAVAHDTRALAEGLVGLKPQLVHGVEDAPVHGLQAIAYVRQGPVDDDRHGVGDEAGFHLLLQIDRNNAFVFAHRGLLLLCSSPFSFVSKKKEQKEISVRCFLFGLLLFFCQRKAGKRKPVGRFLRTFPSPFQRGKDNRRTASAGGTLPFLTRPDRQRAWNSAR